LRVTKKVLFVDDEANVLSAITRQLRKSFEISTAPGGQEGLAMLDSDGPFAVVVSDMRMPGMDGIEFLRQVKDRSPDTVRMMLTGNADQQTAINAVNQGNIFRFYTKPCPAQDLRRAVEDGLRQYALVTAERTLLERTLAGSVKVLLDVLAILAPDAFGKTTQLRNMARQMARQLKLTDRWELDMAAMLSPVGQITLPSETLAKIRSGTPLSTSEQEILARTPEIGRNLIANIPRLEKVSQWIYYQNKGFEGHGFPHDDVAGTDIPLGARILRVMIDLVEAREREGSVRGAFEKLKQNRVHYDPEILGAARACFLDGQSRQAGQQASEQLKVPIHRLRPGDRLISDIEAESGTLVLSAGQEISQTDIERLRNKRQLVPLKEPVHVFRPVQPVDQAS
jgi:response regulator RpfG family c-di-GMP phosphodiesterase